ncbi:MAG TPA: hypothetical protein VK849_13500 [Longimicrobiales bacterium]|nr:hypothetical protein [Longimicrobiales bacterium]
MLRRLFKTRLGLVLALVGDLLLSGGPHLGPTVSQASLDAALAAQAEVTDEWLAMDGVVGTAIGMGRGGEAVLKVYLAWPGAALLPARVAGVPVVFEVTGPIRALPAETSTIDPKRNFERPVPIGVSTGHPDVSAGTIGARVTDGTRVWALSNNHVYANNNAARKGDNLLQPGRADGGRDPDDAIGTLYDFEPVRFCNGPLCPVNPIDAAIALTTPEELDAATPEDGYGAPRSSSIEPRLGMTVQKYGRTTGHTRGRITGINAILDVSYRTGRARFQGQIVISGGRFSAPGDSGSLIVTDGVLLGDRVPVGLLFAGSSTSTIANPIDPVLDRFGVRVDGG